MGRNASADGLGCFGWSSELHFPLFLLIMSEDSLILPQSVSAPVVGLIIRLLPINLPAEIDVHFSFVKYSPCLPIWPLLHPLNKPVIILATVLFQEWVQSFTWLASLLACVYDTYICATIKYSKIGGKKCNLRKSKLFECNGSYTHFLPYFRGTHYVGDFFHMQKEHKPADLVQVFFFEKRSMYKNCYV